MLRLWHLITMLIAQISDTHLAGGQAKTFGIAPMAENLARCVQHINALQPPPDVVLITGDITNDGRAEEAERAARILRKLRFPFYIVPGNHDNPETLLNAFEPGACPVSSARFVNYVISGYDIKIIGLDSTWPQHPGGFISPQQANWLDAHLQAIGPEPVILFMHHPPVSFGVLETDEDGFEGAELLAEVLLRHGTVRHILAGHIHLPATTTWHGMVVGTAPSPGMRLALDLTLTQPSAFLLDDPAYQLHYWTKQNHLITHTVRIPSTAVLHPFENLT